MKFLIYLSFLLLSACASPAFNFQPEKIEYNGNRINYTLVNTSVYNIDEIMLLPSDAASVQSLWTETVEDICVKNNIFNYDWKYLAKLEIYVINHNWGPLGLGYESNLEARYTLKNIVNNKILFDKVIKSRGTDNTFEGYGRIVMSISDSIKENIYKFIKSLGDHHFTISDNGKNPTFITNKDR